MRVCSMEILRGRFHDDLVALALDEPVSQRA
jgi:hypothetical protein